MSGEELSQQWHQDAQIAIDVTPLSRPGADRGLGRYVKAVLLAAEQQDFAVTKLSMPERAGRFQHLRDLLDRQRRLRRMDYDVFHAPNPYMGAAYTDGRNVVSVLDLIPLELDQYRQLGFNAHIFLRKLVPRADRVLALSHFTAERIGALLDIPEDRIVVASLPAAAAFHPHPEEEAADWLSDRGIDRPYVVAVADGRVFDPRKRSEWLPAIGRRLAQAGSQLVVVGPESGRLFDGDARVIAIDRAADRDLARLFSAASALVFTSAYEGQGLPPLEAMACGTPVVAMRNSAIPEVVGAGGVLVDERPPDSPSAAEDLAAVCVELTRDRTERERLATLALRQSSSFGLSEFGAALSRAYLG